MISRRRFLTLGPVLAATATAAPSAIVKAAVPQASEVAARRLTRATFERHRNEGFVVHFEALRPTELKLHAVRDLPGSANRASLDREGQFSVLFHGPRQPAFDQGTFRVDHPAIGTFDLFLVPVGESGDTRHYEAVFNRLGATPVREA
ncbi:MAG TPA: hypothetical protein VMJ70_09135 [Candidatus Sulfotelmatobacter sp.]|nr:hypothetical protein [Candidatus Sulfotelmatobacter sp.]